jgi:hypothetical protein
MNVRRIGSMPLASMVGICLLAALKTAAMGQAPNAKPAPTAQDVLPVYIEEFFLSEAVRSEEHGELQLTVNGMASLGRGSASPAACSSGWSCPTASSPRRAANCR